MWKWMLFLLTLPLMGQVERADLFAQLKQGQEAQIAGKIEQQCIGFQVNAEDVAILIKHETVLLAIFQCLQGTTPKTTQANATEAAKPTPVVEPSKSESVVTTTPSRPKPETRTPVSKPSTTEPLRVEQPQAVVSSGISPIVEALRSLAVGASLTDEGARNQANITARARYMDALMHSSQLPAELPELQGFQAPEWVPSLFENAQKARKTGNATVTLSAAGNVFFRGVDGRDGARVRLGLYLVDRHRQDKEIYALENHFIVGHERFPVTYNRGENSFEFQQIKTRGVDVRLGRYLKKQEPVSPFPGHWVLEVIAHDGSGRLQGRFKVNFDVEAGTAYKMNLKMETARNGVQTLAHELVEQ